MTVSISKLRAGGEAYLVKAVAQGREDYYTGHGEQAGRWLGGGAEQLGLEGEVDPEVFRLVLGGQSPEGEQLVRAKQSGFDLTFSPPKSVSVLWGLGGDEIGRVVQAAHREAVGAALGYLESQAAVVGVRAHGRAGGIEIKQAEGFVAAAFDHRTSRAGDPQLHSHMVLANMGKAEGDRWRALGRHPDIYRHAKTAGALYEAELRRLLSQRLGVDWGWDDTHLEVVGVPKEICELWSKRHAEALAAVEARGLAPTPAAMQAAVLQTRRPKPGHVGVEWSSDAADYGVVPDGVEGLRERWQRESREVGLPALNLEQICSRAAEHNVDWEALGAELAGPHGLTETRASFSRRDVLQAVAGQPGVGAIEALRRADEFLSSGETVSLGSRNGGEERFTSWDLLSQEQHLLAAARDRAEAGVAVVEPEVVDEVVAGRGLNDEQAAMARSLCTSGAGLQCVVGRAGVGKTFALDAARAAWEQSGVEVIGTALSAAAAGELRRGARVEATTVARQVIETFQNGMPAGCVLIVDEASMVDTRSLATLSRAVEKAEGKLVLVGDDRQLPSIEAGGAFARLVERAGAIELTEVRRQESVEDREALADVRHGDLPAGVKALVGRDGRVVVCHDATSLRAAMVADWAEVRAAGEEVLVLARGRQRVEELAVAARSVRRATGEIGDDELTVPIKPEPAKRRSERTWQPDERAYSVGDEVLFGRNVTGKWRRLAADMPGVYNGAAGVVTGLDQDTGTIRVRLVGDDEAEAAWQAAAARQETEILGLTAAIEVCAERAWTAATPAERAEAQQRLHVVKARVHRRLDDRRAGVVTVEGRRAARPGTEVVVDPAYLTAGHVGYAYARSIHRAQGATADVVLIDGSDARGRESAYVALSRHKTDVRLYLTEAQASGGVERHQAPAERAAAPLEDFTGRVGRREAQRTATEQLTRAAVERRRGVRALATRPAAELAAERSALEASPAPAARPAVDEAEVDVPGPDDRRAAWLAQVRLAAERERAARQAVRDAGRESEERRAERERLADLRAAQRLQERPQG